MSDSLSPAPPAATPQPAAGALSRSAQGATYLIILQVLSRGLTFAVNQLLLRYLSPDLLGVATQLELYSITVLSFARESLRVAIQRQGDEHADTASPENDDSKGAISPHSSAGRSQTVVNLSYISIVLGAILAPALAVTYKRVSEPAVVQTPFFLEAVNLYAVAAIIELAAEPAFVVAQQKALLRSRAKAESTASVARCLLTCGAAVWASKAQKGADFGVLPFALGQLGYAAVLLIVYLWEVSGVVSKSGFSMGLKKISSHEYLSSLFHRGLLYLGLSLFLQTIVKHILTQGDTILISSLASPQAIGIYALASGYGGLIARMVFQPIEETSRSYFGQTLSTETGTPSAAAVKSASANLHTLLRFYSLISVAAVAVGPTLAPLLLRVVAGSRWTDTGAGHVLAVYCYYIPALAVNGVTEALVAAVATRPELDRQSAWMFAFSLGFGTAGYVFLRVLGWGAEGLVWANVINMLLRIAWSGSFIAAYLRQRGSRLDVLAVLPSGVTVAAAVVTAAAMRQLQSTFTGGAMDLIKSGAAAAVFVAVLAISERRYLLECYRAVRPQRP